MEKMIFEQRRGLFRFGFPMSGCRRVLLATWICVSFSAPFCLLFVEIRSIENLPFASGLIKMVSCVPILMLILWAGGELDNRAKQALELSDDYVQLGRGRLKIRWSDIVRFRIEPAGPSGRFSKLTMKFAIPPPLGSASRVQFRWIILDDTGQRDAVLTGLKKYQDAGVGKFTIEVCDNAVSTPKGFHTGVFHLFLLALGFFLIANGYLALIASGPKILRMPTKPESTHVNTQFVAWINSVKRNERYRHDLAIAGAIFAASGVGCLGVASTIARRQRRVKEAS